jgi:hypothetical protein
MRRSRGSWESTAKSAAPTPARRTAPGSTRLRIVRTCGCSCPLPVRLMHRRGQRLGRGRRWTRGRWIAAVRGCRFREPIGAGFRRLTPTCISCGRVRAAPQWPPSAGTAFSSGVMPEASSPPSVGGISQEIPWSTPIEGPDAQVSSKDERRVDVHLVSISPRRTGMAWTGRTAAAWKERHPFRPSPDARADTKERVATDSK